MPKVKVINNKGKLHVIVNHDIAGLANILDNSFISADKPLEIGEAKRETHAVRLKKFLDLKKEVDRTMEGYQQQINALSNRVNEIRSEINSNVQENIRRITKIETENLMNLAAEVKALYFKSEHNLVPDLFANTIAGYEVTASSTHEGLQPCNAFNLHANEWATQGVKANYWIQIKLPFSIHLWKVLLSGRSMDSSPTSVIVYDDKNRILFQCALNIHKSHEVIHFRQEVKSFSFRFFFPTSTIGAVNPGLSYIQLFGLMEQLSD